MFAEFEKQIHAIEEEGGPLTVGCFARAVPANWQAYFGPRFTLDEALDLECLRITRIFTRRFTSTRYATGISAAVV